MPAWDISLQFACQAANPNSWISYPSPHNMMTMITFISKCLMVRQCAYICFPDVVRQRTANKVCNEGRLKQEAREKRGNGVHSKVSLCPLNVLHLRRLFFSEPCLPSLIHLGKKYISLVDNQWYPKRNTRKWYCRITRKLIRDCAYMLLMTFKKSATVVIRVDTFCELKHILCSLVSHPG